MALYPRGAGPQDKLLEFLDPAGVTLSADQYSEWIYVGEDVQFDAHLVVGEFDHVTGNETLDVSFQDSADGLTVHNSALASFAQVTATQQSVDGSTAYTTAGKVGHVHLRPPHVTVRTNTGYPYVRAYFNVGGTTPEAKEVKLLIDSIRGVAA